MERIVYADDDADIRDIINGILTKEGYELILAKDGQEAWDVVREVNPDLVILDYDMPKINGVTLCEKFKKDALTKSIPIIMITAYPSQKEASLHAGAVDFINKPIEKTDLIMRIKSVLKVRHIKNELQKVIAYIAELDK
jgi:two-component system, OmpR family, alkaline phosphatase synthesis response regulator PhoP